MKGKRAATGFIILMVAVVSLGCQTVKSSELKTTKAADLEIEAAIVDLNDTTEAWVSAQMQTVLSQVGIDFDQGETLKAAWDTEAGISNFVQLSNESDAWINIVKDYNGQISKTVSDGNYYIKYTDSDGVETTATVPTGTVAKILSPASGEVIANTVFNVIWDPDEMPVSDELRIYLTWEEGSTVSKYREYEVSNTGSYQVDASNAAGPGKIMLANTKKYLQMDGFGQADIDMTNYYRISVTYNLSNSEKSTSGKAKLNGLTVEGKIESVLHDCLRHCAENEDEYFIVEGERYSCCLEK